MIQSTTLKFLSSLQKNNNRNWFEANRSAYEYAKQDIILFTDEVIKKIAAFDLPIANLRAKDCTFRINRDVRFSKDKSPYKNNMAAYFNRAGKKGSGAGYYVHIEPGKSFAAAGLWMPPAEDLAKIRQEIDYNYKDLKKILSASGFKKQFPAGLEANDTLSRPPKGYDENNPAIGYLKMKSFIVSRKFSDKEVLSQDFVAELGKTFKAARPVIDFINRSLD
jgi:uncharacterized protein (TIGR02453 family)